MQRSHLLNRLSIATFILFAFAINTYSLSYTAGANGSIRGATAQFVKYGNAGTAVAAVQNSACRFISWSDGLTDNPRTDTNVTNDIKVTANFATVPGAPSNVTGVRGNGEATVSFIPPISDGGSPISNYIVTTYPGATTTNGANSPITVKGLKNGGTYYFSVKAQNAIGTGQPSGYSGWVIPATQPGKPTIGTPKAGVLQITVPFTPPVSNGGIAITGYTVTAYNAADFVKTTTGSSSPITVTGLAYNVPYTFTVTAKNAIGTGDPSDISVAVSPTAALPGVPTAVAGLRGNGQATVSFTAPTSDGGAHITNYIVTTYPGTTTTSGANSPITVKGLKNGGTYYFSVKAQNAVGIGQPSGYSGWVIPATQPGKPTIGTPKAGVLQITVPFTPPVSNGGIAITGYTMTTSNAAGFVKTTTGYSSPITVTGLAYNVPYTFTVTAKNTIGTGDPSDISVAVSPTAALPGAPTAVTGARGNGQATVSFTAPTSDGGAPITNYIVTTYPGATTTNGANSPITVKGLKNGGIYYFSVKAQNAIGIGQPSGYTGWVFPATLPGKPTIGTAVRRYAQTTVSFTPPISDGGSPITLYTATAYNGATPVTTATRNAGPITVAGLTPGIAYTFKVTATNALGTGEPSEATKSATVAEGRAAVKEIMDETGASSISLALSDGNGIIWNESFGFADKSTGLKTGPETMFCIASCSKMLATVAAMILVDQGKLSLDEPVVTYLPEFSMLSPEYREITIRMLLNHSSGFPGTDYRNTETAAPFTGYAEQVMEGLKNERLKHAPGYLNVYCNDGFTLVEILVKTLTGLSYPEFVQQEILTPLEMAHSRYATEVIPDGSYAKGHTKDIPNNYISVNVYASGGFYSTPSDMSRLTAIFINGGVYGSRRILSEQAIAEMGKDQTLGTFNPLPSDAMRFGLGWDTVKQPGMNAVGIKAWNKGGDVGAYGATVLVAPDDQLAVTVLGATNVGSGRATKIAERIMLSALVERGWIAATPAPLARNKTLPKATPSTAEKNAYSGYYAMSELLFSLSFGDDNSINMSYFKNGEWKPWLQKLKLRSDGWYAGDSDSVSAVRLLTEGGRRYFGTRQVSGAGHYSDNSLYAQRLETQPPLSAVWQSRLGGKWLPVNDGLYAAYPESATDLRLNFRTIGNLPGYLIAGTMNLCGMNPQSDSLLDGMIMKIPQLNGRDLSDLSVEAINNQEWIRFNNTLYQPVSGLIAVAKGQTSVVITGDNVMEWRKLPATGSLSINGARVWRLFDADFKQISYGRGDVNYVLPGVGEATYLMLSGTAGATITLNIAEPYSATIAESRAAIQDALAETGSDSMSVALIDGEKVIWSEAFGVTDKSTGKTATTETLYCIGSVTKVVTAVAVMKLVDQGKVKLDDPLVKYLPDFSMLSPEYRNITVRMLINHSSGFAGTDMRNGFMSVPFPAYPEQVKETLKGERLKHNPGYLNVYCNDGFTMVENLVKAVTGLSYPEFVRQEILVPLGMNNSRFTITTEDLLPGTYANSYVKGCLMTPEFVNVHASGGLFSTPSDMARFAMMLINGGSVGATRILSPESVAEMGTDQTIGTFNPLPSDIIRYGLGWDSVTQPGMKAVGIKGWYKSGGTFAYIAEFIVLPEENLAVTLLTDNSAVDKALPLAEQIVLQALVERGRLAAMPDPLPQTALPEVTPSQTDEDAFSGEYSSSAGLYRASFAADHSLSIEAGAMGVWTQKYTNLKLRMDGWYTGDNDPNTSFCTVIGDGRRYLAMRTKEGYGHYRIELMYAEKLNAKPQATAAWQARTDITYLPANADMHDLSIFGGGADPRFILKTMPGLSGYLFNPKMCSFDATLDDYLAEMFLLIPQNSSRDLSDITALNIGGEEWLLQRSVLFRPLSGVPPLPTGSSTVTFGNDGFNEWFTLPADGTVSIGNCSGWQIFDADFKTIASGTGSGSSSFSGLGINYIMLFGENGTETTMELIRQDR